MDTLVLALSIMSARLGHVYCIASSDDCLVLANGINLSLFSFFYSWHDAGTYDAKTKTGGPNGSIRNKKEYEQAANRGLETAINFCGNINLPAFSFRQTQFFSLFSLPLPN